MGDAASVLGGVRSGALHWKRRGETPGWLGASDRGGGGVGGQSQQPPRCVSLQGFQTLRVLSCDWQRAQEVWDHILPPAAGHTPAPGASDCSRKEACGENY